MKSGKQALRIASAVLVLVVFALGVGCNGFFVDPTLTSIAVSPIAPAVVIGQTVQLTAFGTYDDGSRKQVKSGVAWSSGSPTVASIDPNTGIATGLVSGTSTITASAQALNGTATLTVVLSNVSSIKVTPTSGNLPSGSNLSFTAEATLGNGTTQDISSTATWTVFQSGTTTQPSCITVATGTPFVVTNNGGCTLPLILNVTATYTSGSSTVTSNTAVVAVTS